MIEQNDNEPLSAYSVRLLNVAASLSSSMAFSASAFAILVYVATPDVIEVQVKELFGNTLSRQKFEFLLPPLFSSWLYFAIFAYMLNRVPPKLLQLQKSASAISKTRTVIFYLCFGLLLMQSLKFVESFRNGMTIIALQRTG